MSTNFQTLERIAYSELEKHIFSLEDYAMNDFEENDKESKDRTLVILQTYKGERFDIAYRDKATIKKLKTTKEVLSYINLVIGDWFKQEYDKILVYMLDDRTVENLTDRLLKVISDVPLKTIKVRVQIG